MEKNMNKILIIEDEEAIANLLRMNLTRAGYECTVAYDGIKGADLITEDHYDLGIFDIMLPGVNGYELLEYAKNFDMPVIFLTAKDSTLDKVKGLKLGAEDYITKPFEMIELLARIETVLRRYNKVAGNLKFDNLEIDSTARTVRFRGKEIDLTKKEFELLLLLARNPDRALSRQLIYEQVWECEYTGDSRTVDLHVQRLRKKLEGENVIESVYKVGYRFRI